VRGRAAERGDGCGARTGGAPPPHLTVIIEAHMTASTTAASKDLSWPPVTSVADAVGNTLTG